jgi:hypothetical protein
MANETRTHVIVPALPGWYVAVLRDDRFAFEPIIAWEIERHLKRQRHGEPECPGGPHVDHKLELHRLLHGQVRGSFAAKDAVDIDRGTPERIERG